MKSEENRGFGRRGGELTITQLITIVAAVIFLAIVSYTLYNYYVTGVFWWARNLPEPDKPDGGGETSLEIVRYSLGEGDIEYYTGIEWSKFSKEENIKLGDKIVYRDELVKNFEDFYFSERERETIGLKEGKALIESLEKGPATYRGTKELRAYTFVSAPGGPDRYIVNYNGDLYKRKYADESSDTHAGTASVTKETVNVRKMLNIKFDLDLQGAVYKKSIPSIQMHLSSLAKLSKLIEDTFPIEEISFPGGEYVLKLRVGEIDKPLPVPVLGVNYRAFDVYFKGVRLPITVYFAVKSDVYGKGSLESGFVYVETPEFSKVYSLVGSPSENEKIIIQGVEEWRDKVLENPIEISYTKTSAESKKLKYCGKILLMNNKEYILAYLDKPLGLDDIIREERCEVEIIGK